MINPLGQWGPQLTRFMITGALLGGVDLALFLALVYLGVAYEWANLAGLILGYALGFVLHHSFTFRCESAMCRQSAQKYLLIFLLSLALGAGVLHLALALSVVPLVAKFSAMAAVATSNFLLGRRFVFAL